MIELYLIWYYEPLVKMQQYYVQTYFFFNE